MFADLIEEQRKINKITEFEVIKKLQNSHEEDRKEEQELDLESITEGVPTIKSEVQDSPVEPQDRIEPAEV